MSEDQIVPYEDPEGDQQEKGLADLSIFLAIWDEDYGPQILDFYPKSSMGDLEALTINIFAAFQFFYDTPDQEFKRTSMRLPVSKINRKALVLLEVLHNTEVRGGLQPFVVALLAPDYYSDKELEIFDGLINRIARKYLYEKELILEDTYSEIETLYNEELIKEPDISINDYYSYTAAIDDFKAGVQLFQTKNFTEAYPLLRKALLKFEQEKHVNLIMEVKYLLGTLLVQQKKYRSAHMYFIDLQNHADDMDHLKYIETSTFMAGFCAYKDELYTDAIQEFAKLEIAKKEFVNELQYYAIYGRTFARLSEYDEAIKRLRRAILVSEKVQKSKMILMQQGQIYHELGLLYYKSAVKSIKKSGFKDAQGFKDALNQSIRNFVNSGKIWLEINQTERLIYTYRLTGNIFNLLGDGDKVIDNYKKALKLADETKSHAQYFKILNRLIQQRTKLEMHEEIIDEISKALEKFKNYPILDSYTRALYANQLGDSMMKIGKNSEALINFIKAFNIFNEFQKPTNDEILVLKKIIKGYEEVGENEKVTHYTDILTQVSRKIADIKIEKPSDFHPLGDVREIWIFSRTVGVFFFSYAPESDVDDDLLGGFITALQSISQEVADKTIDSMVFGDNRYSIYLEENKDFYILGRSNIKSPEGNVNKILKTIHSRFWKEFSDLVTNFIGDITPFRRFREIIETFDWTLIN